MMRITTRPCYYHRSYSLPCTTGYTPEKEGYTAVQIGYNPKGSSPTKPTAVLLDMPKKRG